MFNNMAIWYSGVSSRFVYEKAFDTSTSIIVFLSSSVFVPEYSLQAGLQDKYLCQFSHFHSKTVSQGE